MTRIRKTTRGLLLSVAAVLLLSPHARAQGEAWSTYRGNAQRTGNTDGLAGPENPKLLWVLKSKDNYIASPVPAGARLFISGLGAFNTANFACLSADPKAANRTLWTKTTPYLKLPTVSSPAVFGNKLIFGDGMHQTDGATLHCVDVDKGGPIWQHPVPGDLVHLEGSPTIVDGKAYIGGGAAGVICVDINKITLDGKEIDLAAVQKILAQRWQQLLAKYEEDKKKDPCFAIMPTEDQLPRANPHRVWQQGEAKWHVDAPVTVVDGKVLVASAFLDKEKVGDRALYCLDAKTGVMIWRAPLKLNPWGGASVQGNTIVVTGSSIGYYPGALKGAKGMVAAYDLKDGKEKWVKDVSGGVVGCAAISDGAVVVSATDGKVRAFSLEDGDRRWVCDAKTPLFAPVAIAKGVVYAGDFKGVLHAIDLKSGSENWVLDLGAHPDVQAPGMVYGGPIVHSGRVYMATCNLEGPFARQPTFVACVGEK
ncbi:MAG: PQQ-binding-like beta-propeller repeat protein [Planctomycetes bacterium]|nr:PQQ-binding-like beta-propeller repeat protein [Planctomycetota bacterium]